MAKRRVAIYLFVFRDNSLEMFAFVCIVVLGCFGVSIGYAFAVIKKKNVFVCSLSTGVNFTIVPLVFLSKCGYWCIF